MSVETAENRLVLYDYPVSYNCQIVRLVLCEKEIPGRTHKVDIGPLMEQFQPWFMRLNPKGELPVLDHDGNVITETLDIIRYLDDKYPGTKLTPISAEDQAAMDEWVSLERDFPEADFTYGLVEQGTGKIVAKDMERRKRLIKEQMQKNPDMTAIYQVKLDLVTDWQDRLRDTELVDTLVDRLQEMLDKLEERLAGREFIASGNYTLADVVWTALLARLEMLGFKRMWSFGARPNIENYYIRMKQRPSFSCAPVHLKSSLWLVIGSALKAFWRQVLMVVGVIVALILLIRIL
ncbi:MAG TPA: hypothetical protein DCS82_09110 [Rhodospirillaceae bacterium]|nr:hypothetical protein [Rhodospirillaceae bacterium]HAT35861.1 hypothetical protein [Rhodospirillaceae bacterium]